MGLTGFISSYGEVIQGTYFVELSEVLRVHRERGLGKSLCFSTKPTFVGAHSFLLIGWSQLLTVSMVI